MKSIQKEQELQANLSIGHVYLIYTSHQLVYDFYVQCVCVIGSDSYHCQ